VSATYADVDGSDDPGDAVRWQDVVDAWPQVRAYKRRVLDLLAGADPVLDLGCGPGADVVELGGRAVGVDPSSAMCAAAARRGAAVCRGDGHRLPFATGSFGGVRADRVLQHVADPDVVLDEVVRVARPGARVVLAEPDQESLVIHVPGVERSITDRLKVLRRDVGYRNGRVASTLAEGLARRGLTDVTVEPFGLLLTRPDDAFGLPTWPAFWRDEGGFGDDELAAWELAMARLRGGAGGFVYALTFLVVAGRVRVAG
jgi:SAM-dependent methyltransferase